MRYREIKPSPLLAQSIECFWILESEADDGPAKPERILPDGCVELILNFGAAFRELKEDGRQEEQPMQFLVGQMTRPMLIATDGPVELIGIRFQPGGTLPFFATPMNEAANQIVELSALSRKLATAVLVNLAEPQTLPNRVGTLDRLLSRQLDSPHNSQVLSLAAMLVTHGGQLSLDELSRQSGLSNRQLQRKFLSEVGIGPKLLCRILRFQQVFRAVDRNDAGWAGIAADCGYYDQAHLIRDFQQFGGQTPSLLLAEASLLTKSFTRKDRMSALH